MTKSKRFLFLIPLVVVFASFAVVLSHRFAYTPLRFRYVISQIESATTPTEERAAFRLARRYYPFHGIYLPTNQHGVIVEEGPGFVLEFRQVSPFTHQRYTARRTLLAYTNELYLESNVIHPEKY